MQSSPKISALVPVGDRFDASGALVSEYLQALRAMDRPFEIIVIVDADKVLRLQDVIGLAKQNPELRVLQLARFFGESTALTAGYETSDGEIILTLPAYYQVEPLSIDQLVAELEDADIAVGARSNRVEASAFESWRRRAFHWLVRRVGGDQYSDLGCNARAMKRGVLEEVPLYGDQHRFLPLLATRRGFRVKEVSLPQSEKDRFEGRYGVKVYLRRLLDIFSVFFLIRFTKKPLRFFGMIGSVTFAVGAVVLLLVVIERLFFNVGLADRPALLLSSLLVVMGLQLFALGLLGELIIFTHARDIKEYTIEKIVN